MLAIRLSMLCALTLMGMIKAKILAKYAAGACYAGGL